MIPAPRAERAAVLRIRYPDAPPSPGRHALACFAYGTAQGGLPLPFAADGGAARWELWETAAPVQQGLAEGIACAWTPDLLYAAWQVDEAGAPDLESAVADVYRRLETFAEARGYPQLVKVWHYLARINEGADDLERYRRFSVGRTRGMRPARSFPAATAIGFQAEAPLTVFMLAAREQGLRIENPRQVSAYRYPRQYGPQSPSFARATLMSWGQLFVSGTAAVVGHESRHPDDAAAQLHEIAHNLSAVVAEAERRGGRRLRPQALKFYVRAAADLPAVRAAAAHLFPRNCPALFLLGDICRRDLLVEAEGLYEPD